MNFILYILILHRCSIIYFENCFNILFIQINDFIVRFVRLNSFSYLKKQLQYIIFIIYCSCLLFYICNIFSFNPLQLHPFRLHRTSVNKGKEWLLVRIYKLLPQRILYSSHLHIPCLSSAKDL